MKSLKNFLNLAIVLLLLISCKTTSDNDEKVAELIKQNIDTWNEANVNKDVAVLTQLYDETIKFYGQQKDKNECIASKLDFFKKHPDFYQQIFGEVSLQKISETEYKTTFVKRVTIDQNTLDYPSYLHFKKIGDQWKIAVEGDMVTDKNLKKPVVTTSKATALKGDFNGDGKVETMWLEAPVISEDGMDCVGDCNAIVKFSDASFPNILVEQCIGGEPVNLGDLNEDGTDEIGLAPEWFTSCWSVYYVWTYKNNSWIKAVDPITTHCDQFDTTEIPIKKDPKNKGKVIITYSEFNETEGILVKTKSVLIR